MRKYRTDYRLWGAMAFALWVAFLAWDYFAEPYGVVWRALHIIKEGRFIRFVRGQVSTVAWSPP
jgi:hypothetical protein